MVKFHQFIKAYRKDNHDYTYWQDDGTRVTLIAGKDGVTEEWIAILKDWHLEERRSMRHGEGKVVSLEAYCEAMGDCGRVFQDFSSNPETLVIEQIDRQLDHRRLWRGLKALTVSERALLLCITVKGTRFASIAREEGVNESSVRRRFEKVLKRAVIAARGELAK